MTGNIRKRVWLRVLATPAKVTAPPLANRNIRKRVWLRVLAAAFLAAGSILFISLTGIIAYRDLQRSILETYIQKVQVGDTKERVLALLGEPQARFAKGGQLVDVLRKENLLLWLITSESSETWVYGSWSLLRLGREAEDYGIEFDDKGRVSRVLFPTKPKN